MKKQIMGCALALACGAGSVSPVGLAQCVANAVTGTVTHVGVQLVLTPFTAFDIWRKAVNDLQRSKEEKRKREIEQAIVAAENGDDVVMPPEDESDSAKAGRFMALTRDPEFPTFLWNRVKRSVMFKDTALSAIEVYWILWVMMHRLYCVVNALKK